MEIPVTKCQKWISISWFIGSAILFILIILQTSLGHYADKTKEVWSWFLPNVTPTLSLIIGVIATSSFGKELTVKKIDRFVFIVVIILSIFYLSVLLLTILIQPFTVTPPIEMLTQSNLWIIPLQGLVTASLGAFFVKAKEG